MKDLYPISGITKQALSKHFKRQLHMNAVKTQVVVHCDRIRQKHRRMSCRKMYSMVKGQVPIGRDLFEQIGFENGFKVKIHRNKFKTTWATKLGVFPNLLEGLKLTFINQAIQSDIFYFTVEGEHHYGITNMDVYSRRLLSIHGSKSLEASQNVLALKKVLQYRSQVQLQGCIYHSDRGTQYISDAMKLLLKNLKMRPSMCLLPQENAYVERIQGTLKHEYMEFVTLTKHNYQRKLQHIMRLYNHERPHASLGNRTPVEYENFIQELPINQRPNLLVFKWTNPLLTDNQVIDKKKKESKKKNSTSNQLN